MFFGMVHDVSCDRVKMVVNIEAMSDANSLRMREFMESGPAALYGLSARRSFKRENKEETRENKRSWRI